MRAINVSFRVLPVRGALSHGKCTAPIKVLHNHVSFLLVFRQWCRWCWDRAKVGTSEQRSHSPPPPPLPHTPPHSSRSDYIQGCQHLSTIWSAYTQGLTYFWQQGDNSLSTISHLPFSRTILSSWWRRPRCLWTQCWCKCEQFKRVIVISVSQSWRKGVNLRGQQTMTLWQNREEEMNKGQKKNREGCDTNGTAHHGSFCPFCRGLNVHDGWSCGQACKVHLQWRWTRTQDSTFSWS